MRSDRACVDAVALRRENEALKAALELQKCAIEAAKEAMLQDDGTRAHTGVYYPLLVSASSVASNKNEASSASSVQKCARTRSKNLPSLQFLG